MTKKSLRWEITAGAGVSPVVLRAVHGTHLFAVSRVLSAVAETARRSADEARREGYVLWQDKDGRVRLTVVWAAWGEGSPLNEFGKPEPPSRYSEFRDLVCDSIADVLETATYHYANGSFPSGKTALARNTGSRLVGDNFVAPVQTRHPTTSGAR